MRMMQVQDIKQFGPSRHDRLLQEYQQLLRDYSYATEAEIEDADRYGCTELYGLIKHFDYSQCMKVIEAPRVQL